MALLSFDKISLAYGLNPLLENACFSMKKGEKLCLIGRNGTGKSSLFGILSGRIKPDSGVVRKQKEIIISELQQQMPQSDSTLVYDYVASGLAELGNTLQQYHKLSLKEHFSSNDLKIMERLQLHIEQHDGWRFDGRIRRILDEFKLEPDVAMASLSGGWKKRAALAKSVVINPDILLLDEPTNHLDIYAIQWLEKYIQQFKGAILLITHDRKFMDIVSSRVIELDRGTIASFPGNYQSYRIQKDALLSAEDKVNSEFDKKLAREEVWIRQGIKARRTRNEGRVRALETMRKKRAGRRNLEGKAKFNIEEARKSGKLVSELIQVNHQFADKIIIADFSTVIMRGDKLALIGPNGCGKTTLLKIILGQLIPTSGTVRSGTNIDVAYFDQNREAIDLEKTVQDNVSGGKDELEIGGKTRHIVSYLQDFLFSPQRIRTPAKALSGGELNRLVLARLFSKTNNLLVLDEPTNDLDMETLELLEELIANYKGTLLLVSHDRSFVDNTVSSCIVFDAFADEDKGKLLEIVGGFSDWLQYKEQQLNSVVKKAVDRATINKNNPDKNRSNSSFIKDNEKQQKKLSYKEQLRLVELPEMIGSFEKEIAGLQAVINEQGFFEKSTRDSAQLLNKLSALETKLDKSYQEWEQIEEKNIE